MKLQFTEESRLARGPITNANVGNVILVWGEIIKKAVVFLLFRYCSIYEIMFTKRLKYVLWLYCSL